MPNGSIQFVDGLRVYMPSDKAPKWIKANIVIDRDQLTAWLAQQPDNQVRASICESKTGGKLYAKLDAGPRRDAGAGNDEGMPF